MKTNQLPKVYDLEERTAIFGENIIDLCKNTTPTFLTKPIILQLIRSATSIGANYMEANGASSKKDFANKIYICRKEVQETKHWLRMLLKCCPDKKDQILILSDECRQLILIFQKISLKIKEKV
jgi:four helix bundle protein